MIRLFRFLAAMFRENAREYRRTRAEIDRRNAELADRMRRGCRRTGGNPPRGTT